MKISPRIDVQPLDALIERMFLNNVVPHPDAILEGWKWLERQYPRHVLVKQIGESTQGRPIYAAHVAKDVRADATLRHVSVNCIHAPEAWGSAADLAVGIFAVSLSDWLSYNPKFEYVSVIAADVDGVPLNTYLGRPIRGIRDVIWNRHRHYGIRRSVDWGLHSFNGNEYSTPEAQAVGEYLNPSPDQKRHTESATDNHGITWGTHPYALTAVHDDNRDPEFYGASDIGHSHALSAIVNSGENGYALFDPDAPSAPRLAKGVFPAHFSGKKVIETLGSGTTASALPRGTTTDHLSSKSALYRYALVETLLFRAVRRHTPFLTADAALAAANVQYQKVIQPFYLPLSRLDLRPEHRRHELIAEWLKDMTSSKPVSPGVLVPRKLAEESPIHDQVHFSLYEWHVFNGLLRLAEGAHVAMDCGHPKLARQIYREVNKALGNLEKSVAFELVPQRTSLKKIARSELSTLGGPLEYGIFDYGQEVHAAYRNMGSQDVLYC